MSTALLPIGDMTPRLVTTLKGNPGRVMQSFVRGPWSGEYFEAQVESGDGATSDLRISRCDSTGKRLDYAILDGAGHGSSITAEYSDGQMWVWLFWGADVKSAQGAAVRWAYSGTASGARVLQADTEPVADPGIGSAGHTYGKFAIDQQTDRIATAFRSGSTETFALYKLSDYKAAGPEGAPPAALKTATVTWPAGSSFQGFTITDTRAYISRGGSAPGDVEPTLYELDWSTGTVIGTKDVSGLAAVAGSYASGGHNEAEGVCLWRSQDGTPELLFGIVTGPIYSREARIYRLAAPVDGSATKTLLLDLETITGAAMTNAVVDIRYDRLVRHIDGGMTPKPSTQPVKLSETDRIQVFAADHESLTDDSYGFVMHVRSAWDDPTNPGRRISDTWTAQVSAADPDVVALSSVLVAEGTVAPGQIIGGRPGHSPLVDMSGDQITVDGQVVGPHLTGPAGSNEFELRGEGSPVGVLAPPGPGYYYTDKHGTNGAWRWVSTGSTNNSWTGVSGATGLRNVAEWFDIATVGGTWTITTSRTGQVVTISLRGVVTASGQSSMSSVMPPGFVPSSNAMAPLMSLSTTGPAGFVYATPDGSTVLGVAGVTSTDIVVATLSYQTADQWPTSLPGTPA